MYAFLIVDVSVPERYTYMTYWDDPGENSITRIITMSVYSYITKAKLD